MTERVGVMALVAEARAGIEEISAEEAMPLVDSGEIVLVDVRDIRERQRNGFIPGSFHCPRGMLEFWIDPESPYFKEIFGSGKRFVFHCALDWRSVLSTDTARRMGLAPVASLSGGLKAWQEAGGPVEMPPPRDEADKKA